ncbi:winged helix-turn-helix transcriptional regulator [Nonomuraea thailandensis]
MSVAHTEVTHQAAGPCGDDDCGIRDVLDRIGDKWTVLVMVELAKGCAGSGSCTGRCRASRSGC